jgi:hypothetical protein
MIDEYPPVSVVEAEELNGNTDNQRLNPQVIQSLDSNQEYPQKLSEIKTSRSMNRYDYSENLLEDDTFVRNAQRN